MHLCVCNRSRRVSLIVKCHTGERRPAGVLSREGFWRPSVRPFDVLSLDGFQIDNCSDALLVLIERCR